MTNRLVKAEKEKIWIPTMIFENIDLTLRTLRDDESKVYVNRTGSFTRSRNDQVDNIYSGADNAMEISRM